MENLTGGSNAAPSTPSTTPAPAPTATVEPTTTTSTPSPAVSDNSGNTAPAPKPSSDVIASGTGREGLSLELVHDPVTGKRTIRRSVPQVEPQQAPAQAEQTLEGEQVSDVTPTSDQITQAAESVNATVEKYSLDEFSAAIASGNVDGERVPDEYKSQYADFKIRQAMEAYNEQHRLAEQQKEQVEKQLTPEERQQAVKDFYARVSAEAKERAMKDMGLTAEQLENIDLEDDEAAEIAFKTAFEWHRQQLISEVQQRANQDQAAKQAQQAIYQGIMSFVNEAKAKEPNFNAIDQIMQTRYKTMPYAEGRAAEEAINALRNGTITEAQTETLRQYYENVRKEYYAEKNKLSTTPKAAPKPPVVENSGNGNQMTKDTSPDYAALRNAGSIRDRKAWLQQFFMNRPR